MQPMTCMLQQNVVDRYKITMALLFYSTPTPPPFAVSYNLDTVMRKFGQVVINRSYTYLCLPWNIMYFSV